MNVRVYLISDVIVSIVHTRLRLPTEILLKECSRNATVTLLRMVGPDTPPDVGGPSHFCSAYLNNT